MKSKRFFLAALLMILTIISAGCNKTLTPSPDAPDLYPISEARSKTPVAYPIVKESTVPSADQSDATASTPEAVPSLSVPLRTLSMFSDGKGWGLAEHDRLLNTQDKGYTWQDMTPEPALISEGEYSPGVFTYFLDGEKAWYLQSNFETSTLFISSDSGESWTESTLAFPGGQLYFIDENNGYLLSDLGVGAGSQWVALYHTSDGGLTWEQRFSHEPGTESDLPGSGIKNGMTFIDDQNGWITGSVPIDSYIYLYRTRNGGVNWEKVLIYIPDSLSGSFLEAISVICPPSPGGNMLLIPVRVLGTSDPYPLAFFQSLDSGETWSLLSSVPDASRSDFADSLSGISGGEQTLFVTSDGAQTWSNLSTNLPKGESLLQIEAVSDGNLWILTTPTPEDLSVVHLYRSANSGASWELLPAVLTSSSR